MHEKRLVAAGNSRFFYLIAAPAVIAMLATAIVISTMLIWSARHANQVAFARQEQLVALVLGQSVSKIAHDQESITVWDDPVLKLREPTLDLQWLDDNIGVWLQSYFGHDQVYVLDPTNRPVYAMQAGARVDPSAFLAISPAVAPLVEELRRTMHEDPTAGTNETVLTPGAADVGIVSGRPAIVSVKPIVPSSGAIEQVPGSEFLHISVRFLDGTFISGLEQDYLFQGARFAWDATHGSSERTFPIRAKNRQTIGFFVWTPYAPGSNVLTPIVPALAGALLLVALIVALLMLRVRRGAMELQASEAQAQHLAFHDTLTGLPNRALFDWSIDQRFVVQQIGPLSRLRLDGHRPPWPVGQRRGSDAPRSR